MDDGGCEAYRPEDCVWGVGVRRPGYNRAIQIPGNCCESESTKSSTAEQGDRSKGQCVDRNALAPIACSTSSGIAAGSPPLDHRRGLTSKNRSILPIVRLRELATITPPGN